MPPSPVCIKFYIQHPLSLYVIFFYTPSLIIQTPLPLQVIIAQYLNSMSTDVRGFFLSKQTKKRDKTGERYFNISQTYVHHCVFSEFCVWTFKAFGFFFPQFYFDYNVLKEKNKTKQNKT